MAKEVVLHHKPSVELPENAYKIHFLLACSVIREELYKTGLVERSFIFWVTEDTVYAKMRNTPFYYGIKLTIE